MNRPVVPVNLRGAIAALAVVSTLLVAVLGFVYHGAQGPDSFDRQAISAVRGTWPHAGEIAYIVDGLAEPAPAVVLVASSVVACLLTKLWRLAVVAAIAPLAVVATIKVLKPLVMRTIHGDNLAFPSGHTAFATTVALLLALLILGVFRLGRAIGGAVLLGLALIAGAAMALDQIVLEAHYPTDTIGGFLTAVAVVSVLALLTDFLASRSQDSSRTSR